MPTHEEKTAFLDLMGKELLDKDKTFHDETDWRDFAYNAIDMGQIKIEQGVSRACSYVMMCITYP